MSDFELVPWAQKAVDEFESESEVIGYTPTAPLDQDLFAEGLNVVATAQSADEMAQVLAEADLRWVGIDSEFRYSTPGCSSKEISGRTIAAASSRCWSRSRRW